MLGAPVTFEALWRWPPVGLSVLWSWSGFLFICMHMNVRWHNFPVLLRVCPAVWLVNDVQ